MTEFYYFPDKVLYKLSILTPLHNTSITAVANYTTNRVIEFSIPSLSMLARTLDS